MTENAVLMQVLTVTAQTPQLSCRPILGDVAVQAAWNFDVQQTRP